MDGFVEGFDSFRSPITLTDMEPAFGLMNNFPGLNPTATVMENSSLGMLCFFNDGFLLQHPELPVPYVDGTPVYLPLSSPPLVSEVQPPITAVRGDGWASERSQVPALEDSVSMIAESKSKESGSNEGKREKCIRKNKHEHEMAHLRAKRGQATDRHSVSERVRREKINEKMRCLQGLVPGCYKTMGMAVTLDEIIKYVRSLQNQVEFLSMKLSVASAVYDFNLDQLDDAMMPQTLLPSVGDEDLMLGSGQADWREI